MYWWTVAGTLASFVGVAVGLYVLCVAKGAKKAALDASADARKRSLAEELGDASRKVQQVGDFLQAQEWLAVRIRADEILASCKATLTRWPDGLTTPRRDDLLTASTLVHSIAEKAATSGIQGLTPADRKRLAAAQLTVTGLINAALGEARKKEERSGKKNA